MTTTNNRRSRTRANARKVTAAFNNEFGTNQMPPLPPPNPQPAIERMAEGTGLQVDATHNNQPLPPPNYQNPAAVLNALAAAEQPAVLPAGTENALPNNNEHATPSTQHNARQRRVRRGQTTRRQRHRARPPRHVPTVAETYEPCLRSLMDYKLHRIHEKGHRFSQAELLSITDEDICKWMKFRVYGDENADAATTPPIFHRHNTVLFWKKAVSHFMVNNHMQWNQETGTGNPTKSPLIHKLLGHIKRMQVQRRGKPSQARRAFSPEEYEQAQEMFWQLPDKEEALCSAAYFAFQFHMMARLDDTGKFRQPDLQPYPSYPEYGILSRLPWSKNVNDERDAPLQLVLGANDPHYDVLSLMGLWLEYRFENNPEENEFIFCIDGEDDPLRIKDRLRDILTSITGRDDFIVRDLGPTGSHSIRKFSVTFGRGNGCSKVRKSVCFTC